MIVRPEFEEIYDTYEKSYGEGDTKASQIVTAVHNLIVKWHCNGDVFDNTKFFCAGDNDVSCYANWLAANTDAGEILRKIETCTSDTAYEQILWNLAGALLKEPYLSEQNKLPKVGSIYDCPGEFSVIAFDAPVSERDSYQFPER